MSYARICGKVLKVWEDEYPFTNVVLDIETNDLPFVVCKKTDLDRAYSYIALKVVGLSKKQLKKMEEDKYIEISGPILGNCNEKEIVNLFMIGEEVKRGGRK